MTDSALHARHWAEHAACNGTSPRMWFPNDRDTDPAILDRARTICNTCPVRTECLNAELDAMRAGATTFGIFAGTTATQRRAMIGRTGHVGMMRKSIRHGTFGGYRAHLRRGDPPCQPCRNACAAYHAAFRAERRVAQDGAAS